MDVESLYSNIPHEDGIAASQHFLEKNHMPTYANLFMAQLKENNLASCNTRPLTYLQYIDDILITWTASEKELLAFHQRFSNSNHSYSYIIFFDTTIFIKNGTIQTSLYQKPTGRPAYLMWDSFHPHHIKKSIVFSQALRYNWICSNLDDRNKHLHSLRKTFVNRGYHPQVTDGIVDACNPQLNIIRKIARDLQPILHKDTRLKQIFPELPLLSYRQPPNLRKMIVRSALPKTSKAGQKLCTRMNDHRHKINTKSCDTPVGQHFCSQNHSLQDMQVLILKGNFKTEQEMKIYEFKCMELFNTLRQGLNLGSGFM
ncbi:hypothetical protein XELAEV_18010046mg [Xenopus laevis]|uniref:Helix-turn-helix domain-containing protein n=1 Tax=Xenopus laevis TaxID=8355 RepID=A0A974DUN4_XENLA|nr:hypothetical protein XELAEV_18010046mg [Xenopus laevis]